MKDIWQGPKYASCGISNSAEKMIININKLYFFFSLRVFFHEHSRITGLQGKGEGIS